MKRYKLTLIEKREIPFITIGRLKIAIDQGTKIRQLELLKKVNSDMSEMDIKILKLEQQIRELKEIK